MTSQPSSVRAQQARQILDNPTFQDAVKRLTEEYFGRWMASDSVEEREQVHARVEVLQDVLTDLQAEIAQYDPEEDDDGD